MLYTEQDFDELLAGMLELEPLHNKMQDTVYASAKDFDVTSDLLYEGKTFFKQVFEFAIWTE